MENEIFSDPRLEKFLVFWAVPCVYGLRYAKYVLLFSEQFRYQITKAESMPIPKLQKVSPEKTYLQKLCTQY